MDPEIKSRYNKKYYDLHKDKIFEHLNKKELCEECNIHIALYNMSRHKKTKKHNNNHNKFKQKLKLNR